MSTRDPRTRNLIRYGGSFMTGLATGASGVYVQMDDGRRVLDFTSGQMSAILGHSHPVVVDCIRRQSELLIHLFSGMLSEPVVELAGKLASLLPDPLSKVLLLSTGAESNEAALRIAKMYTGGRKGYGPGFPESWRFQPPILTAGRTAPATITSSGHSIPGSPCSIVRASAPSPP